MSNVALPAYAQLSEADDYDDIAQERLALNSS